MSEKKQANVADDSHHYESERKKRGQPEAKIQPPLTPMIDVTFQLLLYFLLTSTFREDEGQIPGSLPQINTNTSEVPLKPITIALQPMGANRENVQYEVDTVPPFSSDKELFDVLIRWKKRKGDSDEIPVLIKPRGDVRWKFIVEVFNASVRAKFKNIGFAPAG